MRQHDSGRHAAPRTSPVPNVDQSDPAQHVGRVRAAWRNRWGTPKPPMFSAQPDPDKPVELVPASLLGYFRHGAAFEVTYGSSQNLWIKSSEEAGRFLYFDDFTPLRYETFGQLDWRNGRTCFIYGGPKMEPDFMPLHSPDEATVIYRAQVLYWHLAHGRPISATDMVFPNPFPEWLDGHGAPAPVGLS